MTAIEWPGLAPERRRQDVPVIGVVSFAHLVSHFFQLVLPPVFPWIRAEFGYSYAQLGFVMSVLFLVSGLGQAAAGFAVDRWGARRVLQLGLASLACGAAVLAGAQSYAGFVIGAALLGVGNCVFHPVDFWLLNHRVSVVRLGPAFSIHGLAGSIGWALAPPFMVALAAPFGWRTALLVAVLLPLAAMALVLYWRDILAPEHGKSSATPAADSAGSTFGFLRLPAIWLCFLFFAFVSAALGGVQSFAAVIFSGSYGLPLTTAAMSITLYMIASGAGMLTGGWWVARNPHLERNITVALMLATAAAVLIGSGQLPAMLAFSLMAVMGFGSGLSGPSRDLLIRRAAPVGATGRVYGVVYSGLDAGIAVGPLAFGRMLDRGLSAEVFFAVAACLGCAVMTTWRVAARAGGTAD